MPTGPKTRWSSAATLTAEEALEQNVIEFIATDLDDLLQQVNGYEVTMKSGEQELATRKCRCR